MTTDAETIEQFDGVMHFIAQAAINITEGLTNIEEGSPIHHAMIKLCQLANDGRVGVRASDVVPVTFDEVIMAVSAMRAAVSTKMVTTPEVVEKFTSISDRLEEALRKARGW